MPWGGEAQHLSDVFGPKRTFGAFARAATFRTQSDSSVAPVN
jgi:hypothetical protein